MRLASNTTEDTVTYTTHESLDIPFLGTLFRRCREDVCTHPSHPDEVDDRCNPRCGAHCPWMRRHCRGRRLKNRRSQRECTASHFPDESPDAEIKSRESTHRRWCLRRYPKVL